MLGDKLPDFSEIILPRINIVQNMSKSKDTFPLGSLILDQKVALFVPPLIQNGNVTRPATPPATLVVLGFRPTRFSEKVAGNERGALFNTEEQVLQAGGTLDYNEWNLKKAAGMKYFQPLADALVAVARPDNVADDDTVFSYAVDGVKYALALWAMKGTAYTAAAKRVFFTARAIGCLRSGGYPSWSYTAATREDTYGANKTWVPVCLPKTKTTETFLAFVRQVLNAPAGE